MAYSINIQAPSPVAHVLPSLRLPRTRGRANSCPPPKKKLEKIAKDISDFNYKMERRGGKEDVSEFIGKFKKSQASLFNKFNINRKRQISQKMNDKANMKKRAASISRMKQDHEINKRMFVREITRKTTAFEKSLQDSEFGQEISEIYKVKLGDRFERGFRDSMDVSMRDIKSIEEFDFLVSDSTSSEEEVQNFAAKKKYGTTLELPRIGEGDELPFSPLTRKKHYFPKIKKKRRKKSEVKEKNKDFDVDKYLLSSLFSKQKLDLPGYKKRRKKRRKPVPKLNLDLVKKDEDSSDSEDPILGFKHFSTNDPYSSHTDRMSEYEAQLYALVNSPRGTINKEIENLKKQREKEKQDHLNKKRMRKEKNETKKFEDKLDETVKKVKGCLKAYLFMNALYDTFLENKREERRLEELSRDVKSLRFQKMFQAKFDHTGDDVDFLKLPSVKKSQQLTKNRSNKKLSFKERYQQLLKQEFKDINANGRKKSKEKKRSARSRYY